MPHKKANTQKMEHNISHGQYNKTLCTVSVTIKEIDLNITGATKYSRK